MPSSILQQTAHLRGCRGGRHEDCPVLCSPRQARHGERVEEAVCGARVSQAPVFLHERRQDVVLLRGSRHRRDGERRFASEFLFFIWSFFSFLPPSVLSFACPVRLFTALTSPPSRGRWFASRIGGEEAAASGATRLAPTTASIMLTFFFRGRKYSILPQTNHKTKLECSLFTSSRYTARGEGGARPARLRRLFAVKYGKTGL